MLASYVNRAYRKELANRSQNKAEHAETSFAVSRLLVRTLDALSSQIRSREILMLEEVNSEHAPYAVEHEQVLGHRRA